MTDDLYTQLKKNLRNLYGAAAEKWLADLPEQIRELAQHWQLQQVVPVNNMSFNFVAKAVKKGVQPVVLKIGFDKQSIGREALALTFFNGQGAVKLLDYQADRNALLLEQGQPGVNLKTLYPAQPDSVMDCYIKTMFKLHEFSSPQYNEFSHVSQWLESLDKMEKNVLPGKLLTKAIQLKNDLLLTAKNEKLLHGDLHQENIIENNKEWLVIDPKGVIGEIEFEAAAFDFVHPSEWKGDVKKILQKRIDLFASKANFNSVRLRNWVFVRLVLSAVWSVEDNGDPNWAVKLAGCL